MEKAPGPPAASPRGAVIAHIGIAVRGLDESMSFYRDVLGLKVQLGDGFCRLAPKDHEQGSFADLIPPGSRRELRPPGRMAVNGHRPVLANRTLGDSIPDTTG